MDASEHQQNVGGGPPHIPLNVLLDFAVQQIYHDLTVLSELLPKKMDMDRKISIVKFASDTRGLFVKILAAVKWLKTAKRFEMCSSIVDFLDQQSILFVDTADRLVELARTELIHARVPCYQIAIASDTLSRGTYGRLPLCIKKTFIPDKTISKIEQCQVLHRLNQVLQNRISAVSSKLSPRIKKIQVRNGMVTMEVPGEFRVTLTLLGERQDTEWTLLNIKMLVEDYEVGYGTTLVHPNQLHMIHSILQSRMAKSKQPITEAYNVLHHFAMNLQLDLLFCQAQMLLTGPMKAYVCIEKYNPVQGLLQIGYWMKMTPNKRWCSQYRLVISFDPEKPQSGLRVRHHPGGQNLDEPNLDDRTGHLSIQKVLSETMYVRCLERLLRLRTRLEAVKPLRKVEFHGNHVPTLKWPLAADGDDGGLEIPEDEYLSVGVNMFSGRVVCVVKVLGQRAEVAELERLLAEAAPVTQLTRCINRLRILLMIDRYCKAIVGLQVKVVKEAVIGHLVKELKEIPADRIYLQFLREEQHYLIVTFTPDELFGIKVQLFLYSAIGPSKIQSIDPVKMSDWYGVAEIPETFAKRNSKVEFIKDESMEELCEPMEVDDHKSKAIGERKTVEWSNLHKRMAAVVSAIDDRLAFSKVIEELEKRGVLLDQLYCEPVVGGLILKIKDLSKAIATEETTHKEFLDNILNVSLRLDTRNKVYWLLECTMKRRTIPIEDMNGKRITTPGQHSFIQELSGHGGPMPCESVAESLVQRFSSYAEMFKVVSAFNRVYDHYYRTLCMVRSYSYNKITIAYGERFDQLMILAYKIRTKSFSLSFGMASPTSETASGSRKQLKWNAHVLMAPILNEHFKKKHDLIWLINYLSHTSAPLLALLNVSRIKLRSTKPLAQLLGIDQNYPVEMENSLIVASEYIVRLNFTNIHIEFQFMQEGRVGIRDCSRKNPNSYGLEAFWKRRMCADENSSQGANLRHGASNPNSPYNHKPFSVPNQPLGQSPMMSGSMSMNMSLSVPPPAHGFNDFFDSSSPRAGVSAQSLAHNNAPLTASRVAFIVDHKTFEKALESTSKQERSPFADFLFGLGSVGRLGMILQAYRQNPTRLGSTLQLEIVDLKVMPDSFRLAFNAAIPQHQHGLIKPWVIQAHVFIDQALFKLKLRLDFVGAREFMPPEGAVRIAERYFEEGILKLQNEVSFFALMSICRIPTPGVFADIAKIMQNQMEPDLSWPWRVSLQTVTESVQHGQKRYIVGFQPNQPNTGFLFIVTIRPTRAGLPVTTRYQLQLTYQVAPNLLELHSPSMRDPNILRLVKEGVERAHQRNECSIWHGIENVLRNFTPSTGPVSQ